MAVAEKLDTKVERGPWKWALYTRAETMQSIPAFLWALKDMGGVCADKSGRAPAKVFAHAEKIGTPLHPRSAPSAMLRELENGTYAGAIKRTKGSRQTYRIPFRRPGRFQYACSLHAAGTLTLLIDAEPGRGVERLRWRLENLTGSRHPIRMAPRADA